MQFLKENKNLFYIAFILPLFFFCLDKPFILWMADFGKNKSYINSLLEFVDPLINFISNGLTLIIIACMLYMLGKIFNKRLLHEVGKSLFIGFVSSGIIVQILKHLVGRERPRLTEEFVSIGPSLKSGYDSFPSGHTAIAFCFAYILAQYFPKYKVIFYIVAIIVGFERVEDISHFPSDVLAGAIVGLIIAKLLSTKKFVSNSQQYA
jgi:undecaprenyl-diphosphatase